MNVPLPTHTNEKKPVVSPITYCLMQLSEVIIDLAKDDKIISCFFNYVNRLEICYKKKVGEKT